ncbi:MULTISPECIES: hypothetical protein [unclassified Mesorhizobium]|uniref:hypothetical protein n=1 Tax=unclassified Mesorhizobium TaxID=325217 RepID=UPI000F75D6B9|nr:MULTISPECIES: hypothetical protein [unclassified Mesorhizobium]AZO54846.1 hypothetical protein EJ077_16370 [Mesorhizobium sp. M8A.F.Ca.ET.057.01.1.1]RWE44171.1 MAG: hypothetical protein EOS80_19690 [Mesorhizobium sp.]
MQQPSHDEKYRSFQTALAAYLDRPAPKKKTNAKAKRLAGVLAWRNKPETVEPMQSNWSTSADNDNRQDPEADQEERTYSVEHRHEITPSLQEMERSISTVEWVVRPLARFGGSVDQHLVPVAGNFETKGGHVVRVGKLRFSDGTQMEKALRKPPAKKGKAVEFRAEMPVGAMLGTSEKAADEKGARKASSKRFFEGVLGARHRYIASSRKKRGGRSYSADESREMLARAIANTPTIPPATVYESGIASGSRDVGELFIGMKKTTCAGGGAISWVDLYTAQRNKETWKEAAKELSREDTAVLDAAMTARNYGDIGAALGHTGAYAAKVGRQRLQAANDNLVAAVKKVAA